jgi:hypothetical protein
MQERIMTSNKSPDHAALKESGLDLLGPNDSPPTEAERAAHRQHMDDLRQVRAAAQREHQRAEVRQLQVKMAERKAAREAGEPYLEEGEPV